MHDDFCVCSRPENMPTYQLSTEFLEIVNFPIKNNPNSAILIRHWLMSSGAEIENTQALMGKSD